MPENSLSRRQARFVSALLVTSTVAEAARQAGIAERTAYTYLNDPNVQAALGRGLDDELADATRLVTAAVGEALSTLSAILKDQSAPAASRVAAARLILDAGPRYRQTFDLSTRLAILEDRQRGEDDGSQ